MTEEELKKAQEELVLQQKAFAENQKSVEEAQKKIVEETAKIEKWKSDQEEAKKKQDQKALEEKGEFEKVKSDYESTIATKDTTISTITQELDTVKKQSEQYLWVISNHFKNQYDVFTKTLTTDQKSAVEKLIDPNDPIWSLEKLPSLSVLFASKGNVWSDVGGKWQSAEDLKTKMLDDSYRRS